MGRFGGCPEVWLRGPREDAVKKRELFRAPELMRDSVTGPARPARQGNKSSISKGDNPESVVAQVVQKCLVTLAEELDGALADAIPPRNNGTIKSGSGVPLV
jgi:hypothetical protein